MEETAERIYADLMRHLGKPGAVAPEVLAALFRDVERLHAQGRITEWQLRNAREAYARTNDPDRSGRGLIGAGFAEWAPAGNWVVEKGKDALESVGRYARARAESYTREDPVRALLVAASVGAVLTGVMVLKARSWARALERRVDDA